MRSNYFGWLIENINSKVVNIDNYTSLLEYMFDLDYEWIPEIELDANREIAGLELRSKFAEELPDNEYYEFLDIFENIPCSVFEMFIALSIDLGRIISYDTDEVSKMFWLMMENMKLLKYKNDGFIVENVDSILRDFMARNYEENGENGAPFFVPLFSRFSKDFNKVDLYSQGSIYLGQFFGKI